ncbi:hypothetical protein MKX01_017759 [Papaver californicum]|nr:hypothetical protein MKX01_017759 [Papaver californicum]
MGSGRLPKKGSKDGKLSKTEKLHDSEGFPLFFEAPSAAVEVSSYVYPMKYRGRSCILSNYSSLPKLVDLWSVLSKEEIALFKTTAFGHLTDIPRDQRWSSTIFCFLLSRQIKVDLENVLMMKSFLELQTKNCVLERQTFL